MSRLRDPAEPHFDSSNSFCKTEGATNRCARTDKASKSNSVSAKERRKGVPGKTKTHRAAVPVAIITTTIIAVASVIGWRVRFPTIGPSYVHLTLSETVITAS